jgi:hypothetical protein
MHSSLPLLENREKWGTPSLFWVENESQLGAEGLSHLPVKHTSVAATLVLGITLLSFAQDANPRPDFATFAVESIWKGTPAEPRLSKDDQTFGSVIRRGAEAPVEFAGHYTVPRWGCGDSCKAFVVVDSISGMVYNSHFSVVELPPEWTAAHPEQQMESMEFHPESRLLKINGCPNGRDCGFYDFEMGPGGLKELRRELLRKDPGAQEASRPSRLEKVDCQAEEIRNPELDEASAEALSMLVHFERAADGSIKLTLGKASYFSESVASENTMITVDEATAARVAKQLFARHMAKMASVAQEALDPERDQRVDGEMSYSVYSYRAGCIRPQYLILRVGRFRPNL